MSHSLVPHAYTADGPQRSGVELTPTGMVPSLPHSESPEYSHVASSNPSDLKLITDSAVQVSHDHAVRQSSPRGRARRIARIVWLTAWLPAVALAYLGFCYIVATRVVPVRVYKIESPTDHMYGIKAGVTTLSILVVGIALLPIKSLVDDLKSEEFFRRLRETKMGVTLEHLNNVSAPSHTISRGITSIFQKEASAFYAGALVSSIVAVLISSLAPAALSVGVIAVDDEVTAFRVGAVTPDSVVVSSWSEVYTNPEFPYKASQAASIGWVQTTLGIDMTFKPTSSKYTVPVPLDLPTSRRARWLSDVLVIDPVCHWTVSDPPIAVPPGVNSTTGSIKLNLTLPEYEVRSNFYLSDLESTYIKNIRVFDSDPNALMGGLINDTTGFPPTTGIMAWMIAQCTNCPAPNEHDKSVIDMSEIPTQVYEAVATVEYNGTTRKTWQIAILVCDPRATIETREVRTNEDGEITVQEDGYMHPPQGNLQLSQTRLLFARSLMAYPASSGPSTGFDNIGQAGQIWLLFGSVPNVNETKSLRPLPINQLTRNYVLAEQAAMRSYLSGALGAAYVPGRTQSMILAFTSSLPHVVTSTIMFVFLAVFINVCYLRSANEQFTLCSVSAALARSNLPSVCEAVRDADPSQDETVQEQVMLESLKGRRVKLAGYGRSGRSVVLE